jgi:hypothetical protein
MIQSDEESKTTTNDGRGGADDQSGEPEESELAATLRQTRHDIRDFFDKVSRIAGIEVQRLKLRAVDKLLRSATYVFFGIAGLACAVYAAVLVISGIRGAVAEWTGRAWIGDLAAGALVLGLFWFGFAYVRGRARKSVLARVAEMKARATAPTVSAPPAPPAPIPPKAPAAPVKETSR